MMIFKNIHLFVLFILLVFIACISNTSGETATHTSLNRLQLVGGPCEGCEAANEYGNRELSNTDTLPSFYMEGPKLKLTGTVYKKDGKTPAENVIVYAYHTDRKGVYPTKGNEKGWAKRHGFLQGWVKTENDGRYTFYTFRPAAYPNRRAPEHIHMTVKEPNINAYYIDDVLFKDDPLILKGSVSHGSDRGGNGLVSLSKEGELLVAERDIILGLNIPNYPE